MKIGYSASYFIQFMASVDDVNQLHIWRMDKSVFHRDESDEGSEVDLVELDQYPVEESRM